MTTTKLDPSYVLAPFQSLIGDCQNNVLMGLRLIEQIGKFPEPTHEELQFLQLSLGGQITDIEKSKTIFKKWIVINGFEDIHKCFRITLERLYVLKTIDNKINSGENIKIEEVELELKVQVSDMHFPVLVNTVNLLLSQPLIYKEHILSFNAARNCLIHTNGIVTKKHCNNIEKDKLTIKGYRFKLFFKNGQEEIIAETGTIGPENSALLLGSEEFEFVFDKDKEIQLGLKQFLDILNTCAFIKADIEEKLKNCA